MCENVEILPEKEFFGKFREMDLTDFSKILRII